MGGRRRETACGGSGTEMYFGDSGGMRDEECGSGREVVGVVLKLWLLRRELAVLVVEAEARDVSVHSDERGIGGGMVPVCSLGLAG